MRAAGGVLWRTTADGGTEVAVVHRPKYDDWSLPKGKLEPGESEPAAAAREVCEETGYVVALGRRLPETRYTIGRGDRPVTKSVQWWAMRPTSGRFAPTAEIDDLRWLSPEKALALLDGRTDAPLRALLAGPLSTRTVLLLRHGSAGDRRRFDGDDRDRPLDETGARQARAAVDVLAAYAPDRIVTAPLERCRAMVRPLAAALDLPVEDDDVVSAAGWSADPDAAISRIADLAAKERCTVVCSQDEVIPGLVAHLAATAGRPVADVSTPKGALWSVCLADDGRLLDLDRWLPPMS